MTHYHTPKDQTYTFKLILRKYPIRFCVTPGTFHSTKNFENYETGTNAGPSKNFVENPEIVNFRKMDHSIAEIPGVKSNETKIPGAKFPTISISLQSCPLF